MSESHAHRDTAGAGHVHHDEHAAGGSGSRGGHGGHTGHGDHVGQFRRLFWINLVISVPVVASSPMFAMILGYTVPQWALLVGPALGTVMYAWGGWPFLSGAVSELRSRTPGMMLLIGLAITVAFFASWGATVGILDHALEFWWELALLIVVMLLGHWIEMRSLAQTTSALDSLAAPAEQTAVECGESLIEHGVHNPSQS
jgi:P-type Cu2+ transporter